MPSRDQCLGDILDHAALLRLAGPRSYERGIAYHSERRVRSVVEDAGAVTAKVRGQYDYQVKLRVKNGEIDYSCTCPIGDEGAFCKHCVAVGLELLQQRERGDAGSAEPSVTMNDVRAHLARQDKKTLIDLIVEQAMDDDRLRERLLMKAAKRGRRGVDLDTFRRAIDGATETHGFVEYGAAYGYARGIEDVIDSVDELLTEGYGAEVIELAEYVLARLEEVIGEVDDSDGEMGGVSSRLQDLHLAGCEQARRDPAALAKRLFELEMASEWDAFCGAAETYAHLLGEEGLSVYRELAEVEWEHVRPLKPGRDDARKYGKRFRITSIMETLARQSGDVDALVAVKVRDLSTAYDFLEIADAYRSARRSDQALEWAERGVAAFPERTDSRLREFLAEEYHRRGRHEEAMTLIWAEFADWPRLDRYQQLKAHADRIEQWPVWREKALAYMRAQADAAAKAGRRRALGWETGRDRSTLVEVLLWEEDADSAWQEAQAGGCSDHLWMELASKREKGHPEDALKVYRAAVEPTIQVKTNNAYERAIQLLRKVNGVMSRLGQEEQFRQYVDSLRIAHKPKRNFIKLLNAQKWAK